MYWTLTSKSWTSGSMEYIIWICLFLLPSSIVLFFSVALDHLEPAVCWRPLSELSCVYHCILWQYAMVCHTQRCVCNWSPPPPHYNYELKLLPHLITDIQNNTCSQKNEIQSEKTHNRFPCSICLESHPPPHLHRFCVACLFNWSAWKCAVWFDDCEHW